MTVRWIVAPSPPIPLDRASLGQLDARLRSLLAQAGPGADYFCQALIEARADAPSLAMALLRELTRTEHGIEWIRFSAHSEADMAPAALRLHPAPGVHHPSADALALARSLLLAWDHCPIRAAKAFNGACVGRSNWTTHASTIDPHAFPAWIEQVERQDLAQEISLAAKPMPAAIPGSGRRL